MTSKLVLVAMPFFFFSKKSVNDCSLPCFFGIFTGEFGVFIGDSARVVGVAFLLGIIDANVLFGLFVSGGGLLIFFYFIKIKNIFIELISLKLRT